MRSKADIDRYRYADDVAHVPFVRVLFVSVFAAILACAIGSLILYPTVERASFIPLVFTLMGSCLLLGPAYGALREAEMPPPGRYIVLLALGAVGGTIMLGVISINTYGLKMGAFFGVITAVSWIILHFATRRVFPSNH